MKGEIGFSSPFLKDDENGEKKPVKDIYKYINKRQLRK